MVARGSRKRGSCRGQGIRLVSDTIHYSWYCTANLRAPFRLIARCIFASLSFIALPLTRIVHCSYTQISRITFRYRKENYSFPPCLFIFLIATFKSNACTHTKGIFSSRKVDHRSLPSLKTFHSFEDAICNDLPLIASDRAVSVTGAQPRKKDSPFGSEAKHRCSRKSIKRPAPVCIEFEREIRVRTVPNPGPSRFYLSILLCLPVHTVPRVHVCVRALLTRNIDQPSSVTRDPRHQVSRASSKVRCYDLFIHRETVDPMTQTSRHFRSRRTPQRSPYRLITR